MRNRTDITRVSPVDRLRELFTANRVLFELAGSAAGGFVLANSFIFGGVSPFGVALTAALPGKHSQCAALGAVLGYVVSSSLLGNMKYIVALVLVVAVKWLLENRLDKPSAPVWNVLAASVGMTIAAAAVLFTVDYTVYELLLAVAEISLASGSAYFLSRTLTVLDTGLAGASRADLSCAVVSAAVVLMGFSGFQVGSLSVGRILAVILILLCARYGGEAAGAVAGITAGIAIGLTGREYGYVVSAYALGGLVAGIFSQGGRLAAAGAFIVVNALTALFITGNVDVYTAVLEIFSASVLFMLVPQRWAKKWKMAAMRAGPDGSPQSLLRGRLAGVSRALREIGATTRQVSEKLGKLEGAGFGDLQVRVADKVCRHCGSRTTCWQFHYDETTAAMKDCLRRMKKDGSLSREDVPRYLSRTCCKLDTLLTELNSAFRDNVAREGVQRKVSQVRSVVTDQFDGIAIMLDEISGEVCSIRQAEPPKQARIREYLQRKHFQSDRVLCYTDEFGRMKLEITIPTYQLPKVEKAGAALDLSALLEADFDLPQVNVLDRETTLIFHEKAAFTTELGAYQIASEGHKLCGDAYNYIREQAGKAHLILSDGMGSGGAAAVDSSMASGLITQMLSVGIGHEAALKMVNSALLIKSGEESLATIDICTMDLFTGQAEFYKAGAAPSYILRAGRAGYVESTSLPAGILRGVAFEKSAVTLRAGDTVVLVSDGVVATGTEWVASELELLAAIGDNQRLCEKLAMTAKLRRQDGREDDITVLAATLQKGV